MRKRGWISIVLTVGMGLMLGLNSGWVSAEPPNAGVESFPPAAPSNPSIRSKSSTTMNIAWTDNSSDESEFLITYGLLGRVTNRTSAKANVQTARLDGLLAATIYCFTVQAMNHWGASAPTTQVCGRTDTGPDIPPNAGVESSPPAAPSNPFIQANGSSSMNMDWRDNSSDEVRFDVYIGKPGGATARYSVDANKRHISVSGLLANTSYCFTVQAVNHWGASAPTPRVCATTNPDTSGPQTKTADVTLVPQPPVSGFVPYLGKFPAFGLPIIGNLKKITSLASALSNTSIAFVRIGHRTDECGNPSAIVILGPGQSTTPETMNQIYGTSTPPTDPPVPFLACVFAPAGSAIKNEFIKISYTAQ
jgi:hypothetical protein